MSRRLAFLIPLSSFLFLSAAQADDCLLRRNTFSPEYYDGPAFVWRGELVRKLKIDGSYQSVDSPSWRWWNGAWHSGCFSMPYLASQFACGAGGGGSGGDGGGGG